MITCTPLSYNTQHQPQTMSYLSLSIFIRMYNLCVNTFSLPSNSLKPKSPLIVECMSSSCFCHSICLKQMLYFLILTIKRTGKSILAGCIKKVCGGMIHHSVIQQCQGILVKTEPFITSINQYEELNLQ